MTYFDAAATYADDAAIAIALTRAVGREYPGSEILSRADTGEDPEDGNDYVLVLRDDTAGGIIRVVGVILRPPPHRPFVWEIWSEG